MRRFLLGLAILWSSSAWALPARAEPGVERSPEASDDDEAPLGGDPEPAQVKALLEHDIPDSSDALSDDVDRWVLHDVLQTDFAMSRPAAPGDDVDDALLPHSLPQAERPWIDALVEARRCGRLRGAPEQAHKVDVARLEFDIPLHAHPLVDVYIDYFTGRGRWFFGKWLDRASRFIPMMQPVLEAAGVPKDLVYVAMIESGFSHSAYSTAAAAGYWQFIRPTGKLYGLRHDTWVDERRDFIRATQAAARYLGALHRQMGDWHLAWASYNAGEGRIRRAMTRYGTRDFWRLIAHPQSLAKETMHYVPKVIAAAMIAKDPARYGFTNRTPLLPLRFDIIKVSDAVDLHVVAKRSRVGLDTLRELNPALLRDVTPPGRITELRVPQGQGPRLARLISGLPRHQRLAYYPHRVRPGDTLFGLARRFKAEVETIKQLNHLKSARLRPGQNLIIPRLGRAPAHRAVLVRSSRRAAPPRHRRGRAAPRAAPAVARADASDGRTPTTRHVVLRGETLWSIARHYGVTVDRIKRARQGHGARIVVGDVLEIL